MRRKRNLEITGSQVSIPKIGSLECPTFHLIRPLDILHELQLAARQLVDLYNAGSTRARPHNHELGAAWYPFDIKERIIHRFLDVADYLRLCQFVHVCGKDLLSTLIVVKKVRLHLFAAKAINCFRA